MRNAVLTLAALAAALPGVARAQYQSSSSTATFVPLAGGTAVAFPEGQDVDTLVPVGFPFRFYDSTYDHVDVSSNGTVHVGMGVTHSRTPLKLPSASPPFGMIAPWWSDLAFVAGAISYKTDGVAPNRTCTIEWKGMYGVGDGPNPTYGVSFQLVLHEGIDGKLDFAYGGAPAAGATMLGSVGFEDPSGTRGMNLATCSPSCGPSGWPGDGAVLSASLKPGFDLTGASHLQNLVCTGSSSSDCAGGTLKADVATLIQNLGNQDATAIHYKVYLSTDKLVDASDLLLGSGDDTTKLFASGARSYTAPGITIPTTYRGGAVSWILTQITNSPPDTEPADDLVATSVTLPPPDLAVTAVTGPVAAYLGGDVQVSFDVANKGTTPAQDASIAVFLSDNPVITLSDIALYLTAPTSLAGNGTQHYDVTSAVPATKADGSALTEGSYYLGVFIDPFNTVLESNENNNVKLAAAQVKVSAPAPDLQVPYVQIPNSANAGETFPVRRAIVNTGNRDADADYNVYLSSNDIISVDDILVGTGTVHVAANGLDDGAVLCTLPANLVAGNYYVGVIVNPLGTVKELDLTNDTGIAPTQLAVGGGTLQISTGYLPDAVVGIPYHQELVAIGGLGSYSYTLVSGQLPPGLSLSPEGVISGTPTDVYQDVIGIEVTSGSMKSQRGLAIRSIGASGALAIATTDLPPGFINRAYSGGIVAVGGVPPYKWTAAAGLPPGITANEDGTLQGTPTALGRFTFTGRVSDASGNVTQGQLTLTIVSGSDIAIATTRLKDADVNANYVMDVEAAGGKLPYKWTVNSGHLPDGLKLTTTTDNKGEISGIPVQGGIFTIELEVVDSGGLTARTAFLLRVATSKIVVKAVSLSEATQGAGYSAKLTTTGGETNLVWSLYGGALPDGLKLDPNGSIGGTVKKDADTKSWHFIAAASDDKGGFGYGALSIKVNPTPPPGKSCGCSGGLDVGIAGLAGLGLTRLRRRRPRRSGASRRGAIAAIAALALLAAPRPATAGPADYQSWSEAYTFTALSGATLLTSSYSYCYQTDYTVNLPFTYTFYGKSYSSVVVSPCGAISFDPTGTYDGYYSQLPVQWNYSGTNQAIVLGWAGYSVMGQTGQPTGAVSYKLMGTAPNRSMVVEWKNMSFEDYTSYTNHEAFTFQVWLDEGTNVARVVFGAKSGTVPSAYYNKAGVGIQDDAAVKFLLGAGYTCNGSCTGSNWAANTRVSFGILPDLRVADLQVAPLLYPGAASNVQVRLVNEGGIGATVGDVHLYLSHDQAVSADDVDLGVLSFGPLVGGNGATKVQSVTLPGTVAPGPYYVLAVADPANAVQESNEGNNLSSASVLVSQPAPDLSISAITLSGGPTYGVGDTAQATVTVQNNGTVDAVAKVGVYLSPNAFVSTADSQVGAAPVSVAKGASVPVVVDVSFAGASPGTYTVGAIADPDNQLRESDELNNTFAKSGSVTVLGGAVQIATTQLPSGTAGIPYSARLQAQGGDGTYAWSFTGTMPDGLSFDPGTGLISGTPKAEGDSPLTFFVSSAGGNAQGSFSLHVGGVAVPLTVVSRQLPWGVFGEKYSHVIVAAGGVPPYSWSTVGGASLPAGLGLAADGTVEGLPNMDGDFSFDAQVTDSASPPAAATQTIKVSIAPPGRPTIVGDALPDGRLNVAYQGSFQAIGGQPPYAWLVLETRRLPAGLGDPGESVACKLPPGLDVDASGVLKGKPTSVGTFAITLRAYDSSVTSPECANPPRGGDTTTVMLRVLPDVALSITTTGLPDAETGKFYGAKILVSGTTADSKVVYSIVNKDAQPLPLGFQLTADGTITGKAAKGGRFDFIVRVQDQYNRWDLRPLSIEVKAATQPPSGCGCGSGLDAGLFGLVAGLLLLARRRRLGAALALVVALSLPALSACSSGSKDLCSGVTCQGDGNACDSADGKCKCGGAGGPVCGSKEKCDTEALVCTADLCAKVVCGGDSVCDPADGACKCGIAGPTCTETQRCDLDNRVCLTDTCTNVFCSAGETCDPADGKCKCGSAPCNAGEVCDNKTCVAKKCAGVACSGSTVCDGADGKCKCNGAICLYGQTCGASGCATSNLCSGVNCSGGTACDPADGRCKCGMTAVCGLGQSCDVVKGQCIGGDLCANATCQGALSCDPESGKCLCGGLGGLDCPGGQTCAKLGATTTRCVVQCDPLHQDCPNKGADGCYFEPAASLPYCEAAGTNVEGDGCSSSADCMPGLHCNGLVAGGIGTCAPFCNTQASPTTCKPGTTCTTLDGAGTNVGVCKT